MKPFFTTIKLLCLVSMMLLAWPATFLKAEVKPYKSYLPSSTNNLSEEKKPAKKEKKEARKTINTKFALNNKVLKLYPDIIKREMHVVTKEDDETKDLDFFVFSTDGTLIQQHKMKPKEHKRITGLERGVYVYRVFDGDEETATGKFEIR